MILLCEILQLDIPDMGRNHILSFFSRTRDLFRQLVLWSKSKTTFLTPRDVHFVMLHLFNLLILCLFPQCSSHNRCQLKYALNQKQKGRGDFFMLLDQEIRSGGEKIATPLLRKHTLNNLKLQLSGFEQIKTYKRRGTFWALKCLFFSLNLLKGSRLNCEEIY